MGSFGRFCYADEGFTVATPDFMADPSQYLAGLFIAFGPHGTQCADFVKTRLPKELGALLKCHKPRAALEKSFLRTDHALLSELGHDVCSTSGCVSVIVFLQGDAAFIASAGDGSCLIGRRADDGSGVTVPDVVTVPHVISSLDERRRICDLGFCGAVDTKRNAAGEEVGSALVWVPVTKTPRAIRSGILCGLEHTRAFGHAAAKHQQVCTAQPEIKEVPLDASVRFFVLASRGVWSALDPNEAVDIVLEQCDSPHESSAEIVDVALARAPEDASRSFNTTAQVLVIGTAQPV